MPELRKNYEMGTKSQRPAAAAKSLLCVEFRTILLGTDKTEIKRSVASAVDLFMVRFAGFFISGFGKWRKQCISIIMMQGRWGEELKR